MAAEAIRSREIRRVIDIVDGVARLVAVRIQTADLHSSTYHAVLIAIVPGAKPLAVDSRSPCEYHVL
jgi:hypothetical protein